MNRLRESYGVAPMSDIDESSDLRPRRPHVNHSVSAPTGLPSGLPSSHPTRTRPYVRAASIGEAERGRTRPHWYAVATACARSCAPSFL